VGYACPITTAQIEESVSLVGHISSTLGFCICDSGYVGQYCQFLKTGYSALIDRAGLIVTGSLGLIKQRKSGDPIPIFNFMRKMSDLLVYSELVKLDQLNTILDTLTTFFFSRFILTLSG
jgi:hypothetical protein